MRSFLLSSFILGFLYNTQVLGQDSVELKTLSQISQFVDTIKIEHNHVRIRVTWLNDTIELRSLVKPVTYDLETARKYFRDSTYSPSIQEMELTNSIVETSAQNCYSNALERYFRFSRIESDMLFNEKTSMGLEAFETIIKSAFIKTGQFSTKKKKHFKDQLADGTLIVFRNEARWMNHAFYYQDGVFYSKNGRSKLKEYDNMKDIFKVYWDTPMVEFYEMNDPMISSFLTVNE